MSADFIKNNLIIVSLSLIAGFLIAVNNLSMFFILFSFVFFWFVLERFESSLVLLVFYLPFQVALNVAAGFDLASGRVFILFLFMVWIFRSLKNKKLEIDFSLETLLLTLFLFFAIFSLSQSFEMDRAIRKILVFLSVFPLYFVLTSLPGRKDFILKIVKALLAGGLIISLFGAIQFFAQFFFGINPLFDCFAKIIAPVFYGNTFAAEVVANPSWLVNVGGTTLLRAFAIFSDPHIFSFYLGLITPIAFAVVMLPSDNLKKAGLGGSKKFVYLAFLFLTLAELLTFSRGGYMGMFAGFFTLIVLFWKRFASGQKKALHTLLVIGIVFATTISSSVLTRFFSSFDLTEGSNMERMKNWRQGLDIFSDKPLTGVGIGNYSFYLDPTTAYRTPIYAHNLYLDLGAELGIFALLAWVLLIVVIVVELFIASRRTSDKTLSYLALGLIGSFVWYSVHSFFDTSIYAPNILAILTAILSLAVLVIRYVKMEEGKV
ncbi:MAG: O-antigen ligase family protein [Candidatus Pacebacteria bacterium]|nr:O-antigen ligase family protein [Candidatus Paceibacterota bacterium]